MHNEELILELLDTLEAINQSLNEMKQRHEKSRTAPSMSLDDHPAFYSMQDMYGRPMATELLLAKSNVLLALRGLCVKETDE